MFQSKVLRFLFGAFFIAVQPEVFAVQSLPSTSSFNYVGEIPLGCGKVRNENGRVLTPTGFKISPDEAMKLAVSKAGIKCNSKLQIVIYADSANYYIFNSILLPSVEKIDAKTAEQLQGRSLQIDGHTGQITDNRRN